MTDPPETPRLPRRIEVGDAKPSRAVRKEVRERLERGELVGLPTETVYGIAARADDPAAVARLREVKGRNERTGLTWHVSSRDVVDLFEGPHAVVRRLVERYWPGPLTLVLRGVPEGLEHVAQDGWTGVRLPAHRATLGLLDGLGFPVVVSSANRSGEEPLIAAAEVAAQFEADLALVVDGGPCRLTKASGVLRVGNGRFELIREGLLRLEDLRKSAGLRIAFVCTGNTCRSPMAEGLARDLIAKRLGLEGASEGGIESFGFHFASLGVAASSGAPASAHAVEVLADRGIDIKAHRSTPAVLEIIRTFDRVFCLTSTHRAALLALLPPSASGHIELLDPNGADIADPIGAPKSTYAACADEILAALTQRTQDWA